MAIAALTLTVQNGVLIAFAVLYLPMVEEFGSSRAAFAAVQSAVLLLGGFTGPLIGYAFDRLGPRRLFQWGAIVAAVGSGEPWTLRRAARASGFWWLVCV